jgi:hypothetical protein
VSITDKKLFTCKVNGIFSFFFQSNYKGIGCGLNDDTLGGVIKGGISQFIALEISRGNSRENRAIGRHLPWLYNAPSAIQQGPKEFLDCVAHIRVLSWYSNKFYSKLV